MNEPSTARTTRAFATADPPPARTAALASMRDLMPGLRRSTPAWTPAPRPWTRGLMQAPTQVRPQVPMRAAAPFQTIQKAVTVASVAGEIHVCAGTYVGNFSLSQPVPLRGGYSCDGGWNRTPGYGYLGFDAGFDGVNESILRTATGNCSST